MNQVTSSESDPVTEQPDPRFVAEVKDYRDPFLYGYGFGMRTNFLGYYMKADFAWGIKNGVTQPYTFYLTLGYDF